MSKWRRRLRRRQNISPNACPFRKYAGDPVGFARDVLGMEITPMQRQVIELWFEPKGKTSQKAIQPRR